MTTALPLSYRPIKSGGEDSNLQHAVSLLKYPLSADRCQAFVCLEKAD